MLLKRSLKSLPALQVFTKAWSAALLNAFGDILAQKLVDKNDRLDMKRLGIFTFLVSAPVPASLNPALLGQMARFRLRDSSLYIAHWGREDMGA